MNNISLEESTTDRVTPLLDTIVSKITKEYRTTDGMQKDLLFVLVVVSMVENGLLPVDDNFDLIDPYKAIDKEQLSKWKLSSGSYEAIFMLEGCKLTILKVVLSPLGATAILNAIIKDLNSETYSLCLPISRYVVSPQAVSIPMIFRDLKHFSRTLKNTIVCAVKSRILSSYGYPSASLIGLPDEILLKIMLMFLSVGDIINLCKTCNRMKYLLDNESLWHAMCKRDFGITQSESKEWKEIYKESFALKLAVRKGNTQQSAYSGTIHDYMDYSDFVSYIDNPMWDDLT